MNEIAIITQGITQQANTDDQLLALWVHGRPKTTRRSYLANARRLLDFSAKDLQGLTLADLQKFVDSLAVLSLSTQKQIIASVKSLLTFGHKIGYLPFNVGAVLRTPKLKDKLAERILTEAEVITMLHTTKNPRDALLLRMLYATAARVSELCGLTWADVQPNGDSGQVTLFGKGSKTRAVKLSAPTWEALQAARQGAPVERPVFVSRKGGKLDPSQVHRIIRAAAQRAGIKGNVSAHWLRHSHASHALERGATVALVRDTLGHASLATTSRYTHAKPNDSSALHLII